ncbi:MAG: class I tRNA ligase family protein [Chloroflexota bacterium]|nr:class I tRNA ligase family protein [Chloroflexota bacterium]
MFKPIPSSVDFVAQEHQILDFWQETNAFRKLIQLRQDGPRWSFIDGPITANNPMGVHHGWGRAYKDLYHRFWAMKGHCIRYQNGFDCQGLWVEVEVEKEQGFHSKRDIEEYGIARFVRKCKERVLEYAAVQTEQSIRLGYWMDWNDLDVLRDLAGRLVRNPDEVITVKGPQGPVTDAVERIVGRLGLPELGGSYFTFSTENNYMIWTMLKRCWERGWLYKGRDVMPWCPRCATGISQHEIVTEGYREMAHPGVTLRLPLRGRPGESLLVWTTTPWTLSSNVAAAVGPELIYVKVRQGDQVFYLSKGALPILEGKYQVLEEMKGTTLEGWTYDGPFDELEAQQAAGGPQAHRVILWDEVGEAEGTGIVHIAPGCGAEDFVLSKEYDLPAIAPLDEEGVFLEGFGSLTGTNVSESAPRVFDSLREKELLYKVEDYTHRYPVCWRCGTELVFRLVNEWFISMDELRYDMMEVTRQIRWIPSFGLDRELDWLRNMHDWMISKKRYWGLALPIWECKECGHFEVIGDEHELEERAVAGWEEFNGHTPHRPYVDAVKITCPQCGATVSRISDVGNPWLDAGIVSFSTLQYRTDQDYWQQWYPADWISESFPGQFRNWFYSLLAMATVLENTPPFKNCFSYATLLTEDGRAMHKSWGNMIEFNEAADRMGVDVMRWLYCRQKPEKDLLFGYGKADEVRRQFLIPLWNVYSFFVTYANIDRWAPSEPMNLRITELVNSGFVDSVLDRWILARLHEVTLRVTDRLENYDAYGATLAMEPFLDDLTNWYVRRSRRRFWKGEQDADKNAAYATLYHVLTTLCRLLAPIVPFVTEAMYQNLVCSVDTDAPESVHHTGWPVADEAAVDTGLLAQMALARQVAGLGRSARESAGIKLRQPLACALVHLEHGVSELDEELEALVRDELNVERVEFVGAAEDLVTYRLLPDNKVLGPRFGKRFPAVRAALAALEPVAAVRRLRARLPLRLDLVLSEVEGAEGVEREEVELAPEEVLVREEPREGLAVASERGVTVAVDVVLTPNLVAAGLAREVVRRVQNLRKEAGFNLDDRIVTTYRADGELAEAIEMWRDFVVAETLSIELRSGLPDVGAVVGEDRVEGHPLTLGVRKG